MRSGFNFDFVQTAGRQEQKHSSSISSASTPEVRVTTQVDVKGLEWTECGTWGRDTSMAQPSVDANKIPPEPNAPANPGGQKVIVSPAEFLGQNDGARAHTTQASPVTADQQLSETVQNKQDSPSSSDSAEVVVVSPEGSDSAESGDDGSMLGNEGDREASEPASEGGTSTERRSTRHVRPAKKLQDTDFVSSPIAGQAVESTQRTASMRVSPVETKVKKLGETILELADRFPWQAVEDDRRDVWNEFHNRIRSTADVKTIITELLWMTDQIDDCVLEQEWEEAYAEWKARCRLCEDVAGATELLKEYESKAVDWNATQKLYQLEKEEERRKLGRKALNKRKVPRIQQPRPLSAAEVPDGGRAVYEEEPPFSEEREEPISGGVKQQQPTEADGVLSEAKAVRSASGTARPVSARRKYSKVHEGGESDIQKGVASKPSRVTSPEVPQGQSRPLRVKSAGGRVRTPREAVADGDPGKSDTKAEKEKAESAPVEVPEQAIVAEDKGAGASANGLEGDVREPQGNASGANESGHEQQEPGEASSSTVTIAKKTAQDGSEESKGGKSCIRGSKPKGLARGREMLNRMVRKIHYHAFKADPSQFPAFHKAVSRSSNFEKLQQQLVWVVDQLLSTVMMPEWESDRANWEFGYRACTSLKEFEQSLSVVRNRCIDWDKVNDPALRALSPPASPVVVPVKRPFQDRMEDAEKPSGVAKKGKLALKAATFRASDSDDDDEAAVACSTTSALPLSTANNDPCSWQEEAPVRISEMDESEPDVQGTGVGSKALAEDSASAVSVKDVGPRTEIAGGGAVQASAAEGAAGPSPENGQELTVHRKTANLALVRKYLNKFVKRIPYTAFVVPDRQLFKDFHKQVDTARTPAEFRTRALWVAEHLLPEVFHKGWEERRERWEKAFKACDNLASALNLIIEFKTLAYDQSAAQRVIRRSKTREEREMAEEKEREMEELRLTGRAATNGKRKRVQEQEQSEAELIRGRIGAEILKFKPAELPDWGSSSLGLLKTWEAWSECVRMTANEVGVDPLEVQHVWKHGRMPRLKAGADATSLIQHSQNDKTKFKLVQKNLYRVARPKEVRKEDVQVCDCELEPEGGRCCETDKCVNRAVFVECCASRCLEGCQNQRLQRQRYPRSKVFFTGDRGYGLRVEEKVRQGELVQEYMGEVISRQEWQRRLAEYTAKTEVYMFTLDKDLFIDASVYGSLARFINHSCEPNCFTQKWQVGSESRVGIFAGRDIEAGEELTYNYIFESFGEDRHECFCGADACAGYMGDRPRHLEDAPSSSKRRRSLKGQCKQRAAIRRRLPPPAADGGAPAADGTEPATEAGASAARSAPGTPSATSQFQTMCWDCKRGKFARCHYSRNQCRINQGHRGVDWRLDRRAQS